jgi:hypothetical protein
MVSYRLGFRKTAREKFVGNCLLLSAQTINSTSEVLGLGTSSSSSLP